MQVIKLQAPGMQAIAPLSWSGLVTDALIIQIERITQQGRPQLRQMNTDLMRSSRCDGHLKAITLGAALQQRQLTVGFQSSPNQPVRWGRRSPHPTQQGMGPLDHIRCHVNRHPEIKAGDTLRPGLIKLAGS